jgi:diguanylate cyclase (GGDEF)-like protein
VADDDAQVLDAYRRVLDDLTSREEPSTSKLDDLSAELFGSGPSAPPKVSLLDEVVYCHQGDLAVRHVSEAIASGEAFAIVFIDMRMPPGIDGLETARRIRAIDPHANIVIVTGYSDHKPAEITAAVGSPEKLFYLLKPFDGDELQQLATALVSRWAVDIGLAEDLAERVVQLEQMYAELKASEARAQAFARLDALTGLLNRPGLSERFQIESGLAVADARQLTMLYLDLDRFKDINDTLGHAVGDEVICEFARRVKDAAGHDGFAGRLGGDEFAVVCLDHSRVGTLSQRLLHACSAPYTFDGHTVRTSVSIGIATSDPDSPDLIETMRRADIALYAAKAAGRGTAREFDLSMDENILGSHSLSRDLAAAIANDELTLHYQPLVGADGAPISSVEALLRWKHPTKGMVPPLVFIEVAEKSDLIHELGDWVIRRAFADSRNWPDLVTAINLSPVQLRAPDFADRVAALVAEAEVDPHMIEFEVTETMLIDDMERAAETLRTLKRIGFRLALDDFGSGYAGLGYLNQIAFDRLKIDRSFVQDLQRKPGAEGIIGSIVGIGKALGLAITAEGVEDREQHRFLKGAGCSYMQGFLFHRPQPAEDLQRLRLSLRPMQRSA